MSNFPFEPKDGDYVSLIERLGKTSIDEIRDEIAKTQKEHNHHAGQLNSDSIENNISLKNKIKFPSQKTIQVNQTASTNNPTLSIQPSVVMDKIFKVLMFAGFLFVAFITAFIAIVLQPEDEEIIIFPFIIFVIMVAVFSSKLNKRKQNTKEK